ncbi:MAG: hypothetical protein QME78_09010 [Thermodesulfobacteriota bacterium]|nr:hypothetical protein [Thermodesulfobacteriota bacterium]
MQCSLQQSFVTGAIAVGKLSPAYQSFYINDERACDLGQMHNPVPVEGLRILYMLLLEKGFTEEEIGVMCRKNLAKLLGLD